MRRFEGLMRRGLICLVAVAAMSCGGGNNGSSFGGGPAPVPAANNVVSVIADAGPNSPAKNSANTLFTTITICNPGSTTQCQTIDHVQVDTGSYGLRILASVLTLTLPVQAATDGNSLVECTQFVDGYSWGPVALADFTVSGEIASSLPVQVIGDSRFPTVPAACSGTGPQEDTVATFGANGILGIGVFEQDCGQYCAAAAQGGYYYSCSQAACAPIAAPLTSQVLNPVPLFTADNNGTIISLPSVSAGGAVTETGSLIFGIDTEANNASGSQTILQLDGTGDFTTTLNGQTLNASFVDSGSNGLYFNDTSLPACTDANFTGFYCPASTQSFTATLQGTATGVGTVTFSVGNIQSLATANPNFTVFPSLAGPYASSSNSFDWGLPFFFGRRVANAIETKSTSVGTGPYVAF